MFSRLVNIIIKIFFIFPSMLGIIRRMFFHALEDVFHHLEYDLAPSYDLKDDNYHQKGGSYDHFSDKYD